MSKRSIVHIEIPAKDRQESMKFYGELFGWDTQEFPEMMYATWASGSVGGGFSPVGDFPEMNLSTKPGDILLHIESEDIEADLAKIEERGGKTVLPKTDIPGIGWFAVFEDLTGNHVALFTSNGEEQMPGQ